jgi:type VI secretion system protein ImpL
VDAAPSDIAGIFGASSSAAFNKEALGTLVIQRGPLLETRRWAGQGVNLSAELVANYGNWVSGSAAGAAQDTTIFEMLPSPAAGALEYTIEIDGQVLRYRNTPPQWTTMQYPNVGQVPGVKITAVTGDGYGGSVQCARLNGVNRLMSAGQVERLDDSSRITWTGNGVRFRWKCASCVVQAAQGGGDWQRGLQLPERVAGGEPAAPQAPATGTPATARAPAPAAGGAR